MKEITIIGVDLAKNVFQLHGAAADGTVLFRKKLSRPQFQRFMPDQSACLVAMEACGGAHHWVRELERSGHAVKLIARHYVKPFIKRQKNDAADAEVTPYTGVVREAKRFEHLRLQSPLPASCTIRPRRDPWVCSSPLSRREAGSRVSVWPRRAASQ